ncbi:MAG: tetratricopeptide repeat protein [Gemmataceae bacterium]
MLYAILAIALVAGMVVCYLVLAPGPRRARAHRRARRLLQAGDWSGALQLIESLQPERQSSAWRARLEAVAGEAHQLGVAQLLKERRFDEALDHARSAAGLLDQEVCEEEARVVEAALVEVRRLFAAGPGESEALHAAIAQSRKLTTTAPPEAEFWTWLDQLRQGHLEVALDPLLALHERVGKQILDVPLYLGLLLHRLGRPQEALRYLADANRVDGSCPFVTFQMGVSLVAAGGDSGLAMRALQRAVGPRGLAQWEKSPDRLWIEALPEGKSYIRRLAIRHRYVCPLLGGDLALIIRQGQIALAQAFYRQERFQEAADLYGKLLQNVAPTVLLLRGYGLSLARLGQHDQAYKHLRLALDQESPKDPFTGGYLALCGALGKPTNPDDKPRNVTWALKLLARYPVLGNAEWAGLVAAVHGEAFKVGVEASREELELLCDAQASVQAADARAAQAYSRLQATHPDALKPIHAWLYARACATTGFSGPHDLDLFARTFAQSGHAREFFDRMGWDFAEVEYTYLARSAQLAPGQFPAVLGQNYPAQAESFLLRRSLDQEQAGNKGPARESVEVLLRLAPSSLAAHDRLACLHYRAGNLDRSIQLLASWHRLAPGDHWPLVRHAMLEQERGNGDDRARIIQQAVGLTQGPLRAGIAVLGARLALRESFRTRSSLDPARPLLEEALHAQPDHAEALWCLAALLTATGDREALARLAPQLVRPDVGDERFHFLGAIAQVVAGQPAQAVALAERCLSNRTLEAEAHFVLGWAHLHQGEKRKAVEHLRAVADQATSASAPYARALLAQLAHEAGASEEAVVWWSGLDPTWRARWSLDEPLRHSVLLAGLQALEGQRYEEAADRFREAGRLGLRERRLGSLITLALVKAGQRLLFEESRKTPETRR